MALTLFTSCSPQLGSQPFLYIHTDVISLALFLVHCLAIIWNYSWLHSLVHIGSIVLLESPLNRTPTVSHIYCKLFVCCL